MPVEQRRAKITEILLESYQPQLVNEIVTKFFDHTTPEMAERMTQKFKIKADIVPVGLPKLRSRLCHKCDHRSTTP
jgi:hypothetical protein